MQRTTVPIHRQPELPCVNGNGHQPPPRRRARRHRSPACPECGSRHSIYVSLDGPPHYHCTACEAYFPEKAIRDAVANASLILQLGESARGAHGGEGVR